MKLMTARQSGQRGFYLIAAVLVLMVALSPGWARAQTLNIDGGATVTIPPPIT